MCGERLVGKPEKTYRTEVRGGFLWSPKTRKGNIRNPFYDNMRLVRPGDLVFSFWDTRIKAIGMYYDVGELTR